MSTGFPDLYAWPNWRNPASGEIQLRRDERRTPAPGPAQIPTRLSGVRAHHVIVDRDFPQPPERVFEYLCEH